MFLQAKIWVSYSFTFFMIIWYIGCMLMAELVPVLQMAIGPVVLISGVGLLILSLTNRMGRVVDRGRTLAAEMRDATEPKHPKITDQLHILSHRADLLQRSIIFAVCCVLLSSTLVIALFIFALMKIEAAWLISILFVGSVGCLFISLVEFLRELRQALIAFRLDIKKR
jgi:hypothetical protein